MGKGGIPLLLFFAALVCSSSYICMAENNVLYSTSSPDSKCLHSGNTLTAGQYISNNNDALVMLDDCNLVLYRSGVAIWSSGTSGKGSKCVAKMQSDANLVITAGKTKVWSTNIKGKPDSYYVLVLQNDGNLVIYGPSLWATGTNKSPSEP